MCVCVCVCVSSVSAITVINIKINVLIRKRTSPNDNLIKFCLNLAEKCIRNEQKFVLLCRAEKTECVISPLYNLCMIQTLICRPRYAAFERPLVKALF